MLVALLLLPASVWAQVCAAPGNDGLGTASGVVNDYFPGASASTLAAGSTSLTLGTQRTGAANKTLVLNDLLLVIQMQDASINAVNTSAYGNGGSGGQGSTSVGSTGLYEFVKVTAISGSTVTFSPALTNTYRNAAAVAGISGQKTYQVVRVPQYTSASVSGVTAPPWNGSTGGVVAIDARDTLTLNGTTVENQANRAIFLAGKGFRGAVGSNGSNRGSREDWMGDYSTAGGGGGKGEGIAGTPRYMANKSGNYGAKTTNSVASGGITPVDNSVEGYPGGSRARGAPGNAGGGGADGAPAGTNNNQYNSGGGGGGNYAAGGVGGRPWNYPLVDSGGRGGGGYVGTTAFNRIFLGGGGGAGGTNDGTSDNNAYGNNGIACSDTNGRCSSGASGGGIVILRAQNVAGNGVIDVRGANGYNVQNDAAGGGGAGGSVVIHTVDGGSAVIDASGGDGGNAWAGNQTNAGDRHGPGGGGGGGFIAFSPSSMVVTTTINGGTPGYTTNGTTDNYGAFGNQGGIASFQSPSTPGTLPGAACAVDLRLTKSNGANIVNAGGSTTYTFTASNVGASPSSGVITVVDKLPQGVTIPAGSLPLTGANAANWSCSGVAGGGLITCTSSTAIAAGGSSVFGVTVNIGLQSATSTIATNRAKIGGGGDPLNSSAPTEASVQACTGNQSPAGCALDVDAVNSPLLSLTNSDNTDVVLAGGTTTYVLTVNNVGNAPTAGTITVVDVLPTGMSYTGATTFSSGNFSCTYTASSNSVSCTSSTAIPAGGAAPISLPVSIASNAPSALVNLARVGGGSDSSKSSAPTVATTQSCSPAIASEIATGCAADTDAVKRVQLSLTKDDGRFGIYIGGTTTYAFRVSNTGDAATVGSINFRDVLPGPMNWPAALTKTGANAADWTCTRLSTTEVTCTSATPIAAGGVSQFSLLANAGAMNNGEQYMNRARVGGGGDATLATTSPTTAQVNACTNNSIPAGCAVDLNTAQTPPTLRLTKVHANPQSKAPGDTVAFTLTVTNSGSAEALANTVRVVDVFPSGLSNFTVTATQGIFACAMGSGADSNVLTCNNSGGALAAAGTATITVGATVSATTSTTLVNKAQVGTDNTDPTASSYPTSTTAAACTAVNAPTAGCATDSIPVVPSATLTVVSSVTARAASTDQFTVAISNGGPSATTAGTASSASTAAFAATTGTSYTLSEVAAGTTNLARYTTTYACTNATAGGTSVAPGTGTSVSVTPKAGDAITCTFSNTPIAPRLTLAKTIVSRALASDQFTIAINNGGPSAFTTGTAATATTATYTATAGTSYTLSEAAAAGANLARYTSSYSCTNAGVAGTVMPSGTGTSFSLAPQAGDNISCSFSNTAIAPRLTVNTVVAGRILSTDQFSIAINNGGPSASTSGTQTTASAGPVTATAGTSYLLTESAAGTPATNLARYTTSYSCSNATAGGTTVPAGTGTSISVVPQAGDDISCTFTNTPIYPKLSVSKAASPTSLVVGASGQSYRITIAVANGPTTAPISIADSLPAGVTLSGAPTVSGAATLSGCSSSGSSIGACQLASGLADGSYVLSIPVSVAASATTAGAANTANLGGGGDPSCTAAATNESCDPSTGAVVVKTAANVSLSKTGAATAVAGNSYVYTLNLSNSGQTATAANLVVRDQLASGMVATAVTGADCGSLPSAAAALLTCTVADPVAADGGTASIQLTVTMPTGGGNVSNYAATHPSGSGNPGVNPGPACTNAANVVCASSTAAVSTPANVSLSKTGAATALTGSSYVYTLSLSNSGELATGSNLIIKDQLPAGVVATAVSGATCGPLPSSAAALLTCTVASPLAAGASASIQLTVTLPSTGGALVNYAATNPSGSGAPSVDPSAACVNSATAYCASHSLSVNTPASLATTNVLTVVNGSPVPAGYLAKPGDVLTYTVSVTNNGGTAGSTDVGQTVPAGTTYTGTGQGWGAGCTAAGTQCVQPVTVGAGQTSTLQYTVTVASPGSTPSIVDTVTSSVGTCTTCVVSTDTQRADMQASVTVSPGNTSTTGVELTYTSICKNNGPQSAINASCVVTAPAGAVTTCTPTTPAATLASGDSITCTTKLTPGATGDYAVSVATSNTLYDAAAGNNSATTNVKVNTPAALRIAKTLAQVNGAAVPANYAAKIGDTLTYAMLVTNTGGTAGTTVLTETVPEGSKFVGGGSSNSSQGWSPAPQACEAAASTCTQSVTVPAQSAEGVAGEQTVQFSVEVIAPATSNGKITNTVASDVPAACAAGTCSVETTNAVADMQAQITTIPAGAVVVGQSVTITGRCTNNGPVDAVNASCAMVISNGGSSITATCDAAKTLAANESLSCSATFTAAEGAISASINAATQSYESNTANNTDTKSTVGNTPASLATTNVLTAVNGSPVPAGYLAKPGDVLTYTVSVTNNGGTAGSTDVGQTVPAGTTYTGTGQGWGAGCAAAGTQCAQPVAVGAGQTSTVQYSVTVASPGSTPSIVDTVTSSVGTCTTCVVSTDTQRADMQASVTVSPGNTSTTGIELTYTSICKNNGPQTALNAACTVTAPVGAVTVCTPTTPAATLASGSSITCTTKLTPSAAGDYAVSVATSNTLYDAAAGNNSATTTVKVNTPADLRIVKSLAQVNGAAVPANYAAKIGDTLTYNLVVTNAGGTSGTTVLTETVPEGTKFVGGSAPDVTQGWSPAPQACEAAASTCTQSVTVPAQSAEGVAGEQTVQFSVEVIAPATASGKIANTVTSDVPAACAAGTCSVETTNAVADMQAQIIDIPASAVVVGQSVTITGLCTNNGPVDAVNASCAMTVNNGGASIAATCDAAKTLAVNESLSCSVSFTAAEGAISASINAATQSYESNTANNTDTKSTVGNTPASLVTTNVLTLVNGNPVPAGYLAKPGDVLTYTVSVTNNGGTAGSTDVGQTVPAGTTYTGSGQGWGAGCAAAGTQCAQPVTVGAGQTSTVTYTVTVASPGSTPSIVDTVTSSVGTCTTCVVSTDTQRADMQASVTVSPGNISTTGVELTYTSICKNNGPQSAINASCVVTAPAGAVTTCTPTTPAATLASGSSITCTTKLTPSTAGDYAVSVATSNTLYDAAAGNNAATTTVKVNTPADLRIVKSLAQVNGAAVTANYAAKIGDTLTYNLVVTNAGGTAGTTVLTETVPEGAKFVGGIAPDVTQGWSQAPQVCDAAASTCTQSVTVPAQSAEGVAGEQTVQFSVEVIAPATANGKIANTVTSDVPAACAAGTCSVETTNAVADMQALITDIPASAVVVGQSVTITGLCTNNGPVDAVNASCAMTVNNGGTSIAGVCAANATLAVNESLTCSVSFTAAEGAISASITAATQSYESNTANNTDSQSTVGNTPANLATTNVLTAVNGGPVPAGYLAKPGDVLTYTVSVTNNGGTAGSTDVGQTVPAGTSYTGTGEGWSGCAAAGTQCAQPVTVGAGQTSTVQYTVMVASPGSTPSIVDTVTSSVGTCTTCVVTTGTQHADMQATVTVTPGNTSTTGIELIYTSVCKNNGPQTALNALCAVTAPAGAVTTCTPTTPAATLASGDSITCTTKLTPSAAGDYAVSVATSNTLYDAAAGNNSATTTVKVNTPADLRIVKSLAQVNGAAVPANYAAKIGDTLTYNLVVTNAGGTAGTTVLTETVPEGTKFVGGSAPDVTQGWSQAPQACEAAASTCTQSVSVPAQSAEGVAGEQTVQFSVEVIAPATTDGKISNTVSSDVPAACTAGTCSVETANAVADMQALITDIPASAVVVGQSVTITGLCTNNGPANAVNASCVMTVNNGGTSIAGTCSANATLAANESLSCSATFAAAEGSISASITAATQSYESNTANNSDSKSTVGNTPASLATTNVLTAVNGGPVPAGYLAKPGDVLTYAVSVTNNGGTTGSTDVGQTVPAGTTYTGTGQGWGAGCAAAGTQCAQPVTVGAGQTSTVTYTVTVASPGSTPTIVDTVTSTVGTCTTCVVSTDTQRADMQATVTVAPGNTSTTGVELTYTSICKNNGPQSAINASCAVTAPAGAVTTCTPTTPAATLASGDSITCTTKLTPSAAGDYAVSVATSNTLYDAAAGNNTANTSVKVNTPADLRIVKSLAQVNGAAVPANYAAKIGDTLTYNLVVTNAGGTAGTTVLTETVPEGTKFVGGIAPDVTQGWSPAPQACEAAASTCTQSVTVPAQSAEGVAGEKTVQFSVEVMAPATASGKIANTVTSDVPAACAAGTCSVETANAVADMQAQITTIPAGAVVVGQSVTITGLCTNNGPVDAVYASCTMTVDNGGTSIAGICSANATLAVGESLSCTATFTAAEGAISASINAATQSYESDTANNTDSKSTVGNTAASLVTTNVLTAVNGAAVPADYLAKPGDVLTYSVTVVNNGGTVGSTDVGQTVPAGTSYTGTGEGWSGCTAAGTQCTQPVAVGAGLTSTVTYTVTVASPGSTPTIVDTVTSSVGTCTTCVVSTNTQRADMQATVAVTPGTSSTTGVELIYTSVCKNNGPQSAINASCVVTAPVGAVTTCTPTTPAATLASGDSITCTTKLTPSAAGDYAVSVATSNTLYDAAAGNNSATMTVKVNTPADLRIVKSLAQVNGAAVPANYAAKIGDTLTYNLVVSNAGGTASTMVLTETVPEGTRFVGSAADPSQGWSAAPQACDAAASTCTQSVVVPAQSAEGVAGEQTVQFSVEVIAPATTDGKISNTVSSDVPAACAAGACSVETANAVADMQAQITTIPAGAVVVGQSVTISGACTNNGPVDAVNASCEMTVNNGASTVTATCDAARTLAVGESLSCTASFTAAEGTISASLSAATQSYDSNTANNSDSKAVNGNTPSAVTVTNVLVKVNDAPVPAGYVIKPGDKLTYQVQVSNTGGTPGSTVLTETVPVGTRYVGTDEGWTAGCVAAGSSCSRPATVPGGSPQAPGTVSFEYTVRVDETVANPNVVNTVGSSAPGSCSAACSVSTPTQAADMQVSMPATIDLKVGVETVVTSICRNAGPATATRARCEVSGAPADAVTVCTPAQSVDALAAGASISCTTKFTPTASAAVTITTRTSSDVYDPVTANNEASASATFINTPPTAVKSVPVNAAWAMGLMALLMLLLAAKALPQRQGRRPQD